MTALRIACSDGFWYLAPNLEDRAHQGRFSYGSLEKDGRIACVVDEKFGMIEIGGKTVVPFDYENSFFADGTNNIILKSMHEYKILDHNCDLVHETDNGLMDLGEIYGTRLPSGRHYVLCPETWSEYGEGWCDLHYMNGGVALARAKNEGFLIDRYGEVRMRGIDPLFFSSHTPKNGHLPSRLINKKLNVLIKKFEVAFSWPSRISDVFGQSYCAGSGNHLNFFKVGSYARWGQLSKVVDYYSSYSQYVLARREDGSWTGIDGASFEILPHVFPDFEYVNHLQGDRIVVSDSDDHIYFGSITDPSSFTGPFDEFLGFADRSSEYSTFRRENEVLLFSKNIEHLATFAY